jgi:hypothetical protein
MGQLDKQREWVQRDILNCELLCPFSGTTWGATKIPVHKMQVTTARNYSIFAQCRPCGARILIGKPETVDMVIKNSHSIGILGKRTPPKNGEPNG